MALLEIKNVDISYGKNVTVSDCNLTLEQGEICSIVGESGSGKTTVIRAVLGLLAGGGKVTAGEILFEGKSLLGLDKKQWRDLRGHDISMIFQDSGAMMNQTRKIGNTFVEYIRTHENLSKKEAWAKGRDMLTRMHLPDGDRIMRSYPFQLSGGMAQRVTIALAACSRAEIIIADEPTNGLDEEARQRFMELIEKAFPEAAKLLITHDISLAALCGKALVLCGGRMMERGPSRAVLKAPHSGYTQALIAAGVRSGMKETPVLRGESGLCPFYRRCGKASSRCLREMDHGTDGVSEWWCCHAEN